MDNLIRALKRLDDIANRPATWSDMTDVVDLCEARQLIADAIGYETGSGQNSNRYVPSKRAKLRSTGQATRDRLVSERLNLRRE